jgi:hypothetical protein
MSGKYDPAGESDRKERISELKEAILAAKRISPAKLAARIGEIGFACQKCGDCCSGDDNSVVVFPREVRAIQGATGLDWLEVARPPEEGEWDREGCFHTLEWRLKKEGASCRFYERGRCSIYRVRPMLCRTYPFYLDNGILQCSECRGLGGKIEACQAEKMAEELIFRYTIELEEAIALLEGYRDFERGEGWKGGGYIIHDSEGEHRIAREKLIG